MIALEIFPGGLVGSSIGWEMAANFADAEPGFAGVGTLCVLNE